ncbi:MAG: UvrD-helicase domain-containing protein [Spirochaetales bacterium]|nr:UvrD-helicase domain-containing protein [Spirochaetales bacterium]
MDIDFKNSLNDRQYEAVRMYNGPVLILAGAGSGKTRVIIYRIAYLLQQGIPQKSILAVTFTNKAAREMSTRVRDLVGRNLRNLTISTFHAFGSKILRECIHILGYRLNFSIYDQQDKVTLLKDLAREAGFKNDSLDLYAVSNIFSGIKMGRLRWTSFTDQYKDLYSEYNSHLKLYNAVDFDDLITLPIELLKGYPDILKKYRDRYSYFMVDEFQDTSLIQYEFIKLIAYHTKNLCVVGDDDQSIYSWRGANYGNILTFEQDFPGYKEIKLEQNYRSTGKILLAANHLIAHNKNRKEKKLWTGTEDGEFLQFSIHDNEKCEGEFIAEQIKSLKMKNRYSYSQFGVLVRTNSLTRSIEEAFVYANIPYKVSGGMSFFQRKEVKDIISYLRIIANPDDDMNLLRIINVPRRGIGKKSIQYITQVAINKSCSLYSAIMAICHASDADINKKANTELSDFAGMIEYYRQKFFSRNKMADTLKSLVEHIDYWGHLVQEHKKGNTARWKYMNVEGLINSLADYENDPDNPEPGLYSYLNRITILTNDDNQNTQDEDKVNLMTIHSAKGLEFDAVFTAGVEETIIPHTRSIEEDASNIEEERRLFYVAITRAKKYLFLTACRQRRKKGKVIDVQISPFIDEIPDDLIEVYEEEDTFTQEDAENYFQKMRRGFERE